MSKQFPIETNVETKHSSQQHKSEVPSVFKPPAFPPYPHKSSEAKGKRFTNMNQTTSLAGYERSNTKAYATSYREKSGRENPPATVQQ
ncbi:MAG: hypothetical protein GY880_16475 [Planctomycetaceae bacterium]|nr:hypothetical protein [Planctomycetaceae bacterium]